MVFRSAFSLTVVLLLVLTGSASTQTVPSPGSEVSFVFSSETGTRLLDTPAGEGIALSSDWVTVREGDSIGKVLRERSIRPDGQALGLVEAWNPDRNLKWEPGEEWLLPKLELSAEVRAELEAKDLLIGLIVDKGPESAFLASLAKLEDLQLQSEVLPVDRFGSPEREDEFLAAVSLAVAGFRTVRDSIIGGTQPLTPAVLRDIDEEVQRMVALVQHVVDTDIVLSDEDLGTANDVAASAIDVTMKKLEWFQQQAEDIPAERFGGPEGKDEYLGALDSASDELLYAADNIGDVYEQWGPQAYSGIARATSRWNDRVEHGFTTGRWELTGGLEPLPWGGQEPKTVTVIVNVIGPDSERLRGFRVWYVDYLDCSVCLGDGERGTPAGQLTPDTPIAGEAGCYRCLWAVDTVDPDRKTGHLPNQQWMMNGQCIDLNLVTGQ